VNQAMKIKREVSIQAEDFYEDAKGLGDHAASALKANHRSQMSELENIAESALKTSDILDYVKKQTARFPYWRQGYPPYKNPEEAFGERLKNYLEQDLAHKRVGICKRLGNGDKTDAEKQERRIIYLLLMRQFIRQMAVQYEYRVSPVSKKEA